MKQGLSETLPEIGNDLIQIVLLLFSPVYL